MLRRAIFDDGAALLTIIAFALIALIFFYAVWRAVSMGRKNAEKAARMPLEDNEAARPEARTEEDAK